MKRMLIRDLLSTVLVVLMLLSIPVASFADAVPWSSQHYQADRWMSSPYKDESVFGPPLPISVGSCGTFQIASCSSINETQMYSYALVNLTDQAAWAKTSFLGTYTALDETPVFRFNYSLDFAYTTSEPELWNSYAWLTITDVTNSSILYSDSLLVDISSTISVNTIAGHTISVDFGTRSDGDTWLDEDPYSYGSQSMTLNYSTSVSVVPEPISSILFLAGGTLLAGKGYIKRKKTA